MLHFDSVALADLTAGTVLEAHFRCHNGSKPVSKSNKGDYVAVIALDHKDKRACSGKPVGVVITHCVGKVVGNEVYFYARKATKKDIAVARRQQKQTSVVAYR